MTHPEKARAIAATFERQEREISLEYALEEMRHSLNALSNEILREKQAKREAVYG